MAQNLTKEQAVTIANRETRRRQRDRMKTRATEAAVVRKLAVATGGVVIGVIHRKGLPTQVMGVPWKVPAFVALTVLEAVSDNRVLSSMFGGASDALLASYTSRAVANKEANAFLVAGDDGDI